MQPRMNLILWGKMALKVWNPHTGVARQPAELSYGETRTALRLQLPAPASLLFIQE